MRHLLLTLLIAALFGWSPVALAHAALVASEPTDSAQLEAAPAAILLRFDEVVTPLSLRVAGPGLGEVAPPDPDSTLRVVLPPGLGEGVYLVSWRVVSADGHPVAGAFSFGVGRAAPPVTTAPDVGRTTNWSRALTVLRYGFYLAFALSAGGALFRVFVVEPPYRVRRGITVAAVFGIFIAALSVGGLGGLLADAPVGALLRVDTWRLGTGTPFATSLGVSSAGFALCGFAALRTGRLARGLGAVGAVVAAIGFPLAGHAATAEPRWLAAMALTVHALAIAFWLGAFWPLRVLLTERGMGPAEAVTRFSRGALFGVAVLLVAGIVLAALRLPSPAALVGSDYGRLVLAKIVGFAVLLALAAWNRQRLTPRLAAGQARAGVALSRSILAEMGVAALVLGLTAMLVRTPPPGAAHGHAAHDHMAEASARREVTVATELGGRPVLVVLTPGRVGPNRIAVWLGAPAPVEAWAELAQPALGLGPLRRRLVPDGAGSFVHEGPEMAAPGRWNIRLELLVSDFEQISGEIAVDLPPSTGRLQ